MPQSITEGGEVPEENKEISNFPIPRSLLHIPHPPLKLYIKGAFPRTEKYLCIVGGRKHTEYGKRVCEALIKEMRDYSISIVSGLALGIDSIAHIESMKNSLPTIAFPGSGLNDNVLYPASHLHIARSIVNNNGCLISEYEPYYQARAFTFPERNRLMAGLSDAVLVIEAEQKSGTLITAKLALDYNKLVLAVPGSIFSRYSEGANYLIRLGATPIRNGLDIIDALGLKPLPLNSEETDHDDIIKRLEENCSKNEILVIKNLTEPLRRDELQRKISLTIMDLNITLSLLELKGIVEEKLGLIHRTI